MVGLVNFEVAAPPDDWTHVAHLIDCLGTAEFERELFAFASCHASFSVIFAIELNDKVGGRVLLTEGLTTDITGAARAASRYYAEVDYAADEVFLEHQRHAVGRTDLVIQRAEDRDPIFRAKYFDDVQATEEVSVFDRRQDSTFYLGFSSTNSGFQDAELARITQIAVLLVSLVRRHTAIVDSSGSSMQILRERRLDTLRRLLLEHEASLTPREADVCAAIVIGYRAEAIGDLLGISTHTVATHRKRAYAKLNISSQTELFGIFFSGWSV